jgi:hypothetical protein
VKFKVGDRVRLIKASAPGFCFCPEDLKLIGQIGLVVGFRVERWATYYKLDGIEWGENHIGDAAEHTLELVPPDKEQTVRWSECAWSPRALPVKQPELVSVTGGGNHV